MNIKKIAGFVISIVLLLKLYFTTTIKVSIEIKTTLLIIGLIVIIMISINNRK
jgi:hypothetical protein